MTHPDEYADLDHVKALGEACPLQLLSREVWHEATAFTLHHAPLPLERCPELTPDSDTVWLQLFSPAPCVNRMDQVGNQTYREPKYTHSGGLIPRDTALRTGWNAPVVAFCITPWPAFVAQCASEIGRGDPDCIRFRYTFRFEDPLVAQLCLALYHEQHADAPGGAVYSGSLLHTLTTHLLLTASPLAPRPNLPTFRTNGLTRHEVRTIQTYIDAHIDQPITLAEMADTLQMPMAQFRRRFRHTLHMPPHQYLIQRRVERATELLKSGQYSVAQVASAVGFSDQSHLYRHCKRLLGVKPRDVLPDSSLPEVFDQNVQELEQNVQDRTVLCK
jgi:AraC family transcriptional regulator